MKNRLRTPNYSFLQQPFFFLIRQYVSSKLFNLHHSFSVFYNYILTILYEWVNIKYLHCDTFFNLTKFWNVTGLLYLQEQSKRPTRRKVELDLKVKQQKVDVFFLCHGPRLPSDLSLHIVGLSNTKRPFQSPFYFALVDYVAEARI